jgi:hypothetical protein
MIIADTVIQKLLNYLTRQPYREVQELVSDIVNESNRPENKHSREPELPLEDVGGRSS